MSKMKAEERKVRYSVTNFPHIVADTLQDVYETRYAKKDSPRFVKTEVSPSGHTAIMCFKHAEGKSLPASFLTHLTAVMKAKNLQHESSPGLQDTQIRIHVPTRNLEAFKRDFKEYYKPSPKK